MPTYIGNAYEILSQVRYGINEYSTALVQGTDTTRAFQNAELMRNINNAQYYIWSVLFEQFPEYFLKVDQSLTFSSSVASLPSDCFKIKEVLDTDGFQILPMDMNFRHVGSDTGSKYRYYRYGTSIRMDKDSVSETGSISYYSRCRELDTGMTSAGGALSATLATTAKAIADYYNSMIIENVTDSTVDTITDYSAARVCTVSNTWASSKYYGIVSDLPEIFQPLIAEYAVIITKRHIRSPEKPSVTEITLFNEMLSASMRSFAGSQGGDVTLDSVFNDFEPVF